MKFATWNVNSLRVRLPHLLDWLAAARPDVVGLQETKCTDGQFPFSELEAAGYRAVANGQKTYNGVAILARAPPEDAARDLPGHDEEKRVIAATIGDVRFVSVYVVNGQSVGTDKYRYKLRWMAALRDYLARELEAHEKLVVAGDFNVAPAPADTHDPAAWEDRILCSEPERAAFRGLLAAGLRDSFDEQAPRPEKRFTWWDYRAGAFRRNLGLRIDHVLLSGVLADSCTSWAVDTAPRRLARPSDHAPVIVTA